jgi:hypothetical protein
VALDLCRRDRTHSAHTGQTRRLIIEVTVSLARDLPLATLNIKDFGYFADHDGLRIVGVNER